MNDFIAYQANIDLMNSLPDALDRRDWDLLRSILADDFTFAVRFVGDQSAPAPFFQEPAGSDAMIGFVAGAFKGLAATHHMFANHRVKLDPDGNGADTSCYYRAFHAGRGEKSELHQESLGRWDFRAVRDGVVWRIRRAEQNIFAAHGSNSVFS